MKKVHSFGLFAAGAFLLLGGIHAASASVGATKAPAVGPEEKTFACGGEGQPKCPMQAWMKTNMAPAAANGDGAALAKALDYVASHAPPGYAKWTSIAKDGSDKAKSGDLDAAKKACKSCHDEYKAKYKAELRDRPF